MKNTGNLHTLAERIRAKTEQDAQEIESLTRQQFESLSRSLAELSKSALNTTESVIHSNMANLENEIAFRCRIMSRIFGKTCLQVALLMFCVLLTLSLFSWGTMSLQRREAQGLRREISELKAEKEAWDRDFPPLQRAFSGLELYQAEGKPYLLLPEGQAFRLAGTVDQREAWEIVRK